MTVTTAISSTTGKVTPPRRFIYNDVDMNHFLESAAKAELLKVTAAMGKSCSNPDCPPYDPSSPLTGLSPATAALHGSLCVMQSWLQDFPPEQGGQIRFGNPAFRQWHERLLQRSASVVWTLVQLMKQYRGREEHDSEILQEASEQGRKAAEEVVDLETISDEDDRIVVKELCAYLHSAFGHPIRLDYGTGHECSFQVFLFAICKLGGFGSSATEPPTAQRLKSVTLSVWTAYLKVTRGLQTDYFLEPAGSHGVWGLDDYHCLPFYFGASQLAVDGDGWSPNAIRNERLLADEGDRFLYFGCIRYIQTLKKGVPFFEHSPMLNDISQLGSWEKVASGLLRLFEGEVLKKRQVVQHMVFGEIFKADWEPSEAPKEPPQENFRISVEGRAPWAAASAGQAMPPTGAPWAN